MMPISELFDVATMEERYFGAVNRPLPNSGQHDPEKRQLPLSVFLKYESYRFSADARRGNCPGFRARLAGLRIPAGAGAARCDVAAKRNFEVGSASR
jgi:hypothetical protein